MMAQLRRIYESPVTGIRVALNRVICCFQRRRILAAAHGKSPKPPHAEPLLAQGTRACCKIYATNLSMHVPSSAPGK